jgi:hypothetical protein
MFFFREKIPYNRAALQIAQGVAESIAETAGSNPLDVSDGDDSMTLSQSDRRELCLFRLFAFLRGVGAAISNKDECAKISGAITIAIGANLVDRKIFSSGKEFADFWPNRAAAYAKALVDASNPQAALVNLSSALLRLCGRDHNDVLAYVGISGMYTIVAAAAKDAIKRYRRIYRILY